MKRICLGLSAWVFLCAMFRSPACAEAGGPGGYRLFEATSATVNGEVIFFSDVLREACIAGCGAFPGDGPSDRSLSGSRDRLIADTLVVQEEEKLGLGTVDDFVLAETAARASRIMAACPSPCAGGISDAQLRNSVARKLLVREFLRKRVAVFVDVNEEEVQREIQRRASRSGIPPGQIPEETVRKDLHEEKAAREIRNWFDRATSKSRIVLSPLEE